MNSSRDKFLALVIGIFVIGGTFTAGVFVGYEQRPEVEKITTLINKETDKPQGVDFAPFWEAWNLLSSKYVDSSTSTSSKPITDQQKVWGAIAGLANSLGDPYTVFFPPEETKLFESEIRGNFEGVGMEIAIKENMLTVVAPLKDSPAEKAGVKPGDKILKIDGEVAIGFKVEEAVRKIRGKRGTTVAIQVGREGEDEPIDIKITRDTIVIPVLETGSKAAPTISTTEKPSGGGAGASASVPVKPTKHADVVNGVFVVRLFNFGDASPLAFGQAMDRFASSDTNKLLIDLRGNPGGYLEAAVDLASWFVPAGQPIVIEKSGKKPDVSYTSRGYNLPVRNVKVVVLVDQGSASASEILAGALSEYGVAKLVGQKTFGKGSVQELVHTKDDSSLKVTIARWYTPKGRSISHNGLEPDYKVEITKEDTQAGKDPQLEKAFEVLSKGW